MWPLWRLGFVAFDGTITALRRKMTLDAKEPNPAAAPDHQEQEQVGRVAYEPPVLVPLGNVHSLLAAGGMSPTADGPRGQKGKIS